MGIWNVGIGERKSSPSVGSFSMCYNASCKNPVPINQPKSSLTSAAPFDWDVVGPENPVPHSLAKDREYPRIAQAYAVYHRFSPWYHWAYWCAWLDQRGWRSGLSWDRELIQLYTKTLAPWRFDSFWSKPYPAPCPKSQGHPHNSPYIPIPEFPTSFWLIGANWQPLSARFIAFQCDRSRALLLSHEEVVQYSMGSL